MRRRWWALPCAALVLTGIAPGAAAEQAPVQVRDGRSQPVFTADPVRETVWVETGLDGDGDGVVDRVAADVVRPSGTDRPVPVIMDASPYYSCCGRGNESELKTYDEQGRPVGFPQFYDNYFVPRGYATVLVDLSGTNRSEGCVDVGGASDITSAKAVVDWLNGRAPGFDAPSGGGPVEAGWSTGDVGMIGKSYDGTIANGVAATGVEGLRTIVPIGAISSWYDYYRSDGVSFGFNPSGLARTVEEGGRPDCGPAKQELDAGSPANGDVTPMWTERDYVPNADRVTASVFAVHGLGDLNVKTLHLGQWWDALAERDVPRKLWLSQTGHVDPFDFRRAEWVETLHAWFDHWLLGVDNGITEEPAASVERAPDVWADEPTWSGELAKDTVLHPREDGLGTQPGSGTASFTDDPSLDEYDWAADPDQPSPARALFSTAPLTSDVRIAGTGSVTVTATPSTPTAHLSAMLVDYGPATTRDYLGRGEGIRTLQTESCWGENRPGDDACYFDTEATTTDVDFEIIARGWADLANHESLSEERPLEPGEPQTMTFRLATTDHVVPAGHRLALIIGGTDSAFIVAPRQPGEIGLDLSATSVTLPVVGELPALTAAGPDKPSVRPERVPARPDVQLNRDVLPGS
ncbi:X-Pro dipeptidyl-peptidase [Saccharopolyspora kobensis]|uniref:Xaa-Pro dipeptidyl-peptidase n=1 Tax=Saccharopolyspora kobensis TaxID=146035 RepID=A0A1H6EB10_9PSEU|nr:Xaa-Pro dipeptidyl-peptidase [Saccharopolyspora kobensis]SEG94423.1 X-Pro dipeptidyl-peptidase [Saccharopolyspora kobensis]SFD65147.1 X-Pro dipeptidyl-peptidase [Saccharopolyspora kobensis]